MDGIYIAKNADDYSSAFLFVHKSLEVFVRLF